jgi:UDP:flavonoid glycosyltransferase YjiC (YdhE family)
MRRTVEEGVLKKRILLFAEAVTLAHVARPLAFVRGLDRERYEVAIAVAPHAATHVAAEQVAQLPLESIAPSAFLAALRDGKPLYDAATLDRYVDDDLRLIDTFQPDLVVGDFRLSLSASARLRGVPYATITSAYWSPYYRPKRWIVPELPLTRFLPVAIAQSLFSLARPFAFRAHCEPLNDVRRRRGLPALPDDLRVIYTDADAVLYSDSPALFALDGAPASHRFLGPVLWEPATRLPGWWNRAPQDRPLAYVTLGSSGSAKALPRIAAALLDCGLTPMIASAGSATGGQMPKGTLVADYLPGVQAARRAALVVCNGGSLTSYQALAAGVPVLGVCSNLDQFLNMQGVEGIGAGIGLRADRLEEGAMAVALRRLTGEPAFRASAGRLARSLGEDGSFPGRAARFSGEMGASERRQTGGSAAV